MRVLYLFHLRHTLLYVSFSALLSIFFFLFLINISYAATFSIIPSSGIHTIEDTFDVSLLLDTEGAEVNAVHALLSFPPDRLQLVTPSAGKSIVDVWTAQPVFDNQRGIVELQGIVPGGVRMTDGVIATLTFRVRGSGSAVLQINNDESSILLNDGEATEALYQTYNGVYTLTLPPPEGPDVSSPTHPEQTQWYPKSEVVLSWTGTQADGFSYTLDREPITEPDNIADQNQGNEVAYTDISDGVHYFHIKALRNGTWGGTTHRAVRVDTTPPAEFPLEILPEARTTSKQPVIQFFTTDTYSNVGHYEMKLVPLSDPDLDTVKAATTQAGYEELFTEVTSPYALPRLTIGDYDVIVRAHDHAGNVREVTRRIEIVTPFFKPLDQNGLQIGGFLTLSWTWVVLLSFGLLVILGILARWVYRWHEEVHHERAQKKLPEHVKEKLKELKGYEKKYGKFILIILLAVLPFFGMSHQGHAQTNDILQPPQITTISEHISNEEIFYVGGRVNRDDVSVVLHLQNTSSGESMSRTLKSEDGEWFYRHDSFLSEGTYQIWAQAQDGEAQSPPSPQEELVVRATALQIGATRISYEFIYATFITLLALVVLGLLAFILYHGVQFRKKRKELGREIQEAEESLRRGFAILRRDIRAQLNAVSEARKNREPTEEEKQNEEQLMNDLRWVEQYIGREIWDIEEAHDD